MSKSRITIYTDGSVDVRTRLGGYGAVLEYKGKSKEIFDGVRDTTISRMELTACIESIKALKTTNIPVDIYSDSAYVVNCFKDKWYYKWRQNGWINSKKQPVENQDLWKELLSSVDAQDEVVFNKVKGHVGIELNERADVLANKGRKLVEP